MGFSRTHRGSTVCSLITIWETLTGLQQPGRVTQHVTQEFPARSQSHLWPGQGQTWTTYEETPLAPALIHHPGPSCFAPCFIQQPSQACLGHLILFYTGQTNLGPCGSSGWAAGAELPLKILSIRKKTIFFSFVLLTSISKCLIQAKFRHVIRALGSGCDFQHRMVLGKQNPTKHHPTKAPTLAGCSQDCCYPPGAHPLPKQYQ